MSAYDQWLEAPYTRAAQNEAAYEAWCEDKEIDPSEDHWDEFDNWSVEQMERRDEDAIDRGEWGAAWV